MAFSAGIRLAEFWEATPREVDMALSSYQERERRLDFRAGIIASTIANAQRRRSSKAFKPSDFFPSLVVRKAQTPEQQRVALMGFALSNRGKIVRRPREELISV